MVTTVGKILLKHNLPMDLHGFVDSTTLDKKGLSSLFNELVKKEPDVYKKTVSDLTRLGFEISTREGSSVGLGDLVSPVDKNKAFAELEKQIDHVKKTKTDPKQQDEEITKLYYDFADKLNKDILDAGLSKNQTLAKVILSGSRGSPTQYRQTVASPVLVNDERGRPMIDMPIKNSFAEGLSLPEYLAHSFGTRRGLIDVKLSVADAGYLSKQLSRAGMTIKVEEHDCGTHNGLAVDVTDKDIIGTFLAEGVAGFNRNNEITPSVANTLKNKNIKKVVIRSPITCQSSRKFHSGAVCQLCVGRREKGLPAIGDYVGITAATTLGEPLAQGQLNAKHQSSSSTRKSIASGFQLINQLANIPSTFLSKACVAEHDGVVSEIKNAPQGGKYIILREPTGSTREYYAGTGLAPTVKVGDKIEEGDIMSEGIANPSDIVRHKGIGEGRRYFVDAMKSAFDDAGMPVNRRNFELIAKNAVDHVQITGNEGLGDYLPGQIASYQAVEKNYVPRPGNMTVRPDAALNKYLEQPVLHYSIGTRVTSKVQKELKDRGIQSIVVHDEHPPFEPHMVRLLDVPEHEPDWMHQLYSTYLQKRFINAVNSGMTSNIKGPSPVPGLAYGKDFGS